MLTEDERIVMVEAQIQDLRERLESVTNPSDASKLSNSISQAHHMLTGIQHLKLQRLKSKAPPSEGIDAAGVDRLEKAIRET